MQAVQWFPGRMNVPVRGGRLRWSGRQDWLIVDDGWVTLQMRWFGSWYVGPFQVPLPELSVAYPARAGLSRCVGLDTRDGEAAYFWTSARSRDEVLRSLSLRGVEIDPTPRRIRWRSLWRSDTAALHGVTFSTWLLWWLPVGTVLATLLLVSLWAAAPVAWRVVVGACWVGNVVSAVRTWRAARISRRLP